VFLTLLDRHSPVCSSLSIYFLLRVEFQPTDLSTTTSDDQGGNSVSYGYGASVFNSPKTRMENARKLTKFQPKQQKSYETPEFKEEINNIVGLHLATSTIPFSFLQCSMVSELFAAHGLVFQLPQDEAVYSAQVMLFHNSMSELRAMFKNDVIKGSVTFDGWVSGRRKFNGITFHHIDRDFTPRSTVIGFVEYKGKSTAKVISQQLRKYFFVAFIVNSFLSLLIYLCVYD
jgi:hypothetical protein